MDLSAAILFKVGHSYQNGGDSKSLFHSPLSPDKSLGDMVSPTLAL